MVAAVCREARGGAGSRCPGAVLRVFPCHRVRARRQRLAGTFRDTAEPGGTGASGSNVLRAGALMRWARRGAAVPAVFSGR